MTSASPRPLWAAFVGLAAGIVVADQLTKAWLTSVLAPGASTPVVDDLVRLVFSQNRGGLFGLLQGNAPVFAGLSIVVVGLIVGYHARAGRDPMLSITLGLLLGGALGNLVDRIRLGYVVDFVDAGIGNLLISTDNPQLAFQKALPCLDERVRDLAKVAYRERDGEQYTVLWPANSKEFQVP
jgi:signal peptidase II